MKKLFLLLICAFLAFSLLPAQALAEANTFSLGAFDTATGTYKNASGTGSARFLGMSIGFSLEIAGGENIELPTVAGFEFAEGISTQFSKIINMPSGKTAAEIAAFMRQVVISGGAAGQQVSVLLSSAEIEHNTFYWGGNRHFYQYVSGNTPWTSAYSAAKGMTYNGRSGYLATVTSAAEDIFISTLANSVGWLGGTRLSVNTSAEGYSATDWTTWTFNTAAGMGYWYWACGPEAAGGVEAAKFYTSATYVSAATDAASREAGYYFNWDRGSEPNSNGGEPCLATLRMGYGCGTGTRGYSWNDISIAGNNGGSSYHAQGYFVEYGDLAEGDSSGDSLVATGTLSDDGDVNASFPDWASEAGLTSSVATWTGRPLPSTLVLNSDATLTDTLILPDGVNVVLDLNGHTLTGAAGKPVIAAASGSVRLTLKSTVAGGAIEAADGADSATGDGEAGQSVIDFIEARGAVTVESGVTLTAGDGGNAFASGCDGGDGGHGIIGNYGVDVSVDGAVSAGDGGNTADGSGGDGGDGIQ